MASNRFEEVILKSLATITPAHSVATIGTASVSVLAANADRKYACIINDSDAVVYLAEGAEAALNSGIRINANGGQYEISPVAGNLFKGEIKGISSAASKKVLVTEGTTS